jgi:dynein heavy chain
MDPSKMLIWHVNPYGENDPNKDISANNDPYSVLRKSSPWPPRNAKCFQSLNALIERCNDVQELTSTIAQFSDLSATARVGGTLTSTMDAMLAEIQVKSSKSLEMFHNECPNLSNLMDSDRFDLAFFRLRTELKQYEHELAWILRQCFSRATTLSSKLTLLDVFYGAYQRDVVQKALVNEEQWIISNLKQEFQSVTQLVNTSDMNYPHWPPIARQLLYLYGLKQRIEQFMNQFTDLCPKILNSDIGWELREGYRIAKEKIQRLVFI